MLEILQKIPQMQSCCVALGFFDGIHIGHQAVINAAFAGEGTRIVLSVGRRASKALLTEQELSLQLSGLGAEFFVKPDFDEIKNMSGESFVRDILAGKLHAKRVACGENYSFGAGAVCDADDLRRMCGECGIECQIVPLVQMCGETVSATAIRAALIEGDVVRANKMLGRRYGCSLPVVDGQHLGRSLGTPTINQVMPSERLTARFGVYASLTRVEGVWYNSVTNIGVRPTVGADSPVSETWIRGFSGDLYGETVRVELVEFIRPERRFDSLDELKAQIMTDGETALGITGEISQKLNSEQGEVL